MFDCVALDLMLEDGDGLEVLQVMHVWGGVKVDDVANNTGPDSSDIWSAGPITIGASGAAERTSRAAVVFGRLVRFMS